MRNLIESVAAAYQNDVDAHQDFGWSIERKSAGMNGLIFRAQSEHPQQTPLAIKISKRDERKRTEREFGALLVLGKFSQRKLAPVPIMPVEQPDGLPGDALIMEWLPGETLGQAPQESDKRTWQAIVDAFLTLHAVTLDAVNIKLRPAMIPVSSPQDMLNYLAMRRARLPEDGSLGCVTAAELDAAINQLPRHIPEQWQPTPSPSLILCDANPGNMIFHDGEIFLVDWANSGWSDGAFDIADMLAQPSYQQLSEEHRHWVRDQYARCAAGEGVYQRIEFYEKVLLCFWVILMTEPLVGAQAARLQGTKQFSVEHYQAGQERYWERVQVLLV